ncbi:MULTISPECIES: LemA family protein [unclassified Methylophaga]|jgi:LemA protein|uniref:LemA family protein n=1 Tax=unclassified Methylophaga TaxID=2629249 RepID=UPI000C93A1B9|nr:MULTISPECIES: LemA family protein [unclassified Methylophaga]MAK65464.1 LemA protein [Methylophaga sp.]MAY16187.1 LemA protein [Methylophaga sp.]HAO24359.1 LemA family protein [Methylophaga sp.]HCD05573.1 LemA family protein [Methylophaga sp.]|tara:strand:+ start:26195 stop:26773 length:579 start_codon:yes stop_codon:yes gene_type:complete
MEWVLLGIAGLLILYVIIEYNKLVRHRNIFQNAFKQIDVTLKQRHDMIPQLVSTVKGYAQHEQETLNGVIEARNQAEKMRDQTDSGDAKSMLALGQAESVLGKAMGGIFALSEAYPDLKADGAFRDLMEQLTSIENKVAASRRGYNNTVLEYNNVLETFPTNILANMFSFTRASELEFDDREAIQEAPKVEF